MENLQEAKAYTIEQAVEHLKNGGAIENDISNLKRLREVFNLKVNGGYKYYYLLKDGTRYYSDLLPVSKIIKLSQITELSEHPKEAESGEADGWIEIKSESDLPPHGEQEYYCYFKDGSVKGGCQNMMVEILYKNGTLTHYQPIIKPQPPKSNT